MALIQDQGNETLWHDAFARNLDRYSDLWMFVDRHFKEEVRVTLPLDVVRRVVDDLIWETNDEVKELSKTGVDDSGADIAKALMEAVELFDGVGADE